MDESLPVHESQSFAQLGGHMFEVLQCLWSTFTMPLPLPRVPELAVFSSFMHHSSLQVNTTPFHHQQWCNNGSILMFCSSIEVQQILMTTDTPEMEI